MLSLLITVCALVPQIQKCILEKILKEKCQKALELAKFQGYSIVGCVGLSTNITPTFLHCQVTRANIYFVRFYLHFNQRVCYVYTILLGLIK